MKKKKNPLTVLLSILLVIAAVILLVKHFHIKDFVVVKPGMLYTSGQPRGMDYTRLLYSYHIATIVNMRSAAEHRERNWHNEEVTWSKNNGVNYIELPVEKNNYFPDKQTQDDFLKIMDKKENLPVLLHGSTDDERVAMLTAVWLVKSQGYTAQDAAKVAEKLIERQSLTEAESSFIYSLKN